MSNKLTYIEARDKIWSAYFRDEIKPMDMKFCFCGTLSCGVLESESGEAYWDDERYFKQEYIRMEGALMKGLGATAAKSNGWLCGSEHKEKEDYEERLFAGMIAALDVLKSIHKQRGDFIPEDEPLLTKRNLEHA